MFVSTCSYRLGCAVRRYALVLALLTVTFLAGPRPAHAVPPVSSVSGTVVAWGSNSYGQATVPAGLTDVVAIAAAGFYNLALRSDGTVVAWGNNISGQTTVPTGLTDVVAIAAGVNHSLAVRSDGTVVAWGDNSFGQTTIPADLTNAVAVAGGIFHSLALVADSSASLPEIDLVGSGVGIANGDTTPDPTDGTDFGSVDINGGTVVRTFTISNTGDATLSRTGSPLVALSGDGAFAVTSQPASSSVAAGSSSQIPNHL